MSCVIPARFVIISLLFVGFFNIPLLRLNLSIAIISMVNSSSVDAVNSSGISDNSCLEPGDVITRENGKVGTFKWDEIKQGFALGCYFYGFIASAILGPWAAERIGFKLVIGGAVCLSSILTILLPPAAYGGFVYFTILRIIIGFCQGAVNSTSVAAFPAWIPMQHRTVTLSILMSGFFFGAFATLPISALISEYISWETIFYVTGSFSFLWSCLWFALVYNTPEQHPRISAKEKKYLQKHTSSKKIEKVEKRQRIPWLRIVTSLPFLATIIAHISLDWTLTMTGLVLPTYLTRTLNFGIVAAGASAGLPWLMMMVVTLVGERVARVLGRRRLFSLLTIRKGLVVVATVPSAICFILASYTGCSQTLAIILFCLIVAFQGLHIPGTQANVFDLSDRHSSILLGILVTMSQLSGILAPQLTGILLQNTDSTSGWRTIFFVAAGVNIFAALIFCTFASAEEQPWSKKRNNANTLEETQKPMTELQDIAINDTMEFEN